MTTLARTRTREIAARLLATLGVALGFAVISADAGAGLAGGILVGTSCNGVGNFLTQGLKPATPTGLTGSLSSPSPQNPPFTIPPCAGTDFLGPYTGSADISAFVDFGVMKTIGHASASGLSGTGQSSTHLIFSDLVTFDPVNSQFMGASATVQARMQLQAVLDDAKWTLDVMLGGALESFSSHDFPDCSSPCTFDLTWLGILLNTPTQLQVDLNAIDSAVGDASLSLVSSSMDLSQSVYWDGIQSVTVGGEPILFNLISDSGHDWTQSSVPSSNGSVPEPGGLALVALGLAGLGFARCRGLRVNDRRADSHSGGAMTKRAWTRTNKFSARLLVTLSEINVVERERPQRGRVRVGILMTAIRPIFGLVAALALGLGMAAMAQAQTPTFCAVYPCYQVFVNTTDGVGNVNLFNPTPFSSSQQGSNVNGNQQSAFGIADFGSVGSKTSIDVVACPSNCLVTVQAGAGAFYWDLFDVSSLGLVAGDMFQFSMSLSGSFGSATDLPLAQVDATIVLISGANIGSAGLQGNNFFPPQSTVTATVVVDTTFDPFLQVLLGIDTVTSLAPFLDLGSNFADFSTTFTIDNVALLDPSGNFLRNIELTDVAGFTLPGPGPVQTAPEPATLLLVVSALAVLGINAGRKLHGSGG